MLTILFVLIQGFCVKVGAIQVDTLAYAKNFEIQKGQYIGHPFSTLLTNMTALDFKSVFTGLNVRNKYLVPYSTFFFEPPANRFYKGVIGVTIHWETQIMASDVRYFRNRNHANFTIEERQFYGTKIIKDIKVQKW